MNINKMAQKDAETWAAAEMFYGEGAGTRRKLVGAEIESKMVDNPEYEEAFNRAYSFLDMNKFAKQAIKERKKLDRFHKAGKNMRAIKSGNLSNLSTGVFVVVGGVYLARATGFDKTVEAEMKKVWIRVKEEYQTRRDGRRIRLVREAIYNQPSEEK